MAGTTTKPSSRRCRLLSKIRPVYVFAACLLLVGIVWLHQRQQAAVGISTTRRINDAALSSSLHWSSAGQDEGSKQTFAVRQMVDEIRDNLLLAPSSSEYNLSHPEVVDQSRGQSREILKILNDSRGGFFVECGALDGETRSNTLFMERNLGWQGVLIEADPHNFRLLRQKHRKSWTINVCLNSDPTRSTVRFRPQFNVGKIAIAHAETQQRQQQNDGTIEVLCYPLHAIMKALNRTRIDYFSLDVEGAELDVLRNVPFDQLDIRTMSVEYIHTTGGGKPALRDFLEQKGYTVVTEVTQPDWTANDFIVVKNSAFPELVERVKQQQQSQDHLRES